MILKNFGYRNFEWQIMLEEQFIYEMKLILFLSSKLFFFQLSTSYFARQKRERFRERKKRAKHINDIMSLKYIQIYSNTDQLTHFFFSVSDKLIWNNRTNERTKKYARCSITRFTIVSHLNKNVNTSQCIANICWSWYSTTNLHLILRIRYND